MNMKNINLYIRLGNVVWGQGPFPQLELSFLFILLCKILENNLNVLKYNIIIKRKYVWSVFGRRHEDENNFSHIFFFGMILNSTPPPLKFYQNHN